MVSQQGVCVLSARVGRRHPWRLIEPISLNRERYISACLVKALGVGLTPCYHAYTTPRAYYYKRNLELFGP